jgi:integrase/recombinase XerD
VRVVPLAADLVRALRELHRERGLGRDERRPVFIGARGERLTRFGATHVMRRAVRAASDRSPALAKMRVSPHLLRHNTETSITLR